MLSQRRNFFSTLSILAIALTLFAQSTAPTWAATTPAIYSGGVWKDTQGNVIQAHGHGILKVGSTYYWFGEDKTNGPLFQNIKCYSSTDLVNWTFVNNVLTQQASGDLGPNRIVERPHVIYNSSTAKYVMWMHIDSTGYSDRRAGTASSSTVCGNYTYHGSVKPLSHDSLDDTLFQDGATGYFISEDRTNTKLQIYQLSADYLTISSLVATLPQYESPAVVKVGNTYFLFGSHLTGWNTNDNQYTTATSMAGPWSAWQSFAQGTSNTYNSQTTNILPIQGSSTTTYMWMGDRWDASATPLSLANSRYIWLPLNINGTTVTMNWVGGWTANLTTGAWSPVSGTSYEAESAANTLSGAARVQACTGGSGGQCVGYIGNGASNTLRFNNLNVATAGSYDVIIYYSSGDAAPRLADISANGGAATTYNFVKSGGVTSLKGTFSFNAGNNTLLFANSTAYAPDIDRLIIVGAGSGPTPTSTNTPTRTPTGTPGGPTATPTRTPTPGGFPVPGTYYRIINRNSGKVADVSGGSTADGGDIVQFTSNGQTNQQWSFVSVTGGYYKIVNRKSGKLMDVSGGSTADGGDVIQWTDNGGTNQHWSLTDLGTGYYRITNRKSSKVLDVSGSSTADGGDIIQWTSNGGNNQQWSITP